MNWKVGDEIVIASSGCKPSEAEKVTITSVLNDGMTLEFASALMYEHFGEIQTIAGKVVDMRAEVSALASIALVLRPMATFLVFCSVGINDTACCMAGRGADKECQDSGRPHHGGHQMGGSRHVVLPGGGRRDPGLCVLH